MFTPVYSILHVFSGVCLCLPLLTRVYLCLPHLLVQCYLYVYTCSLVLIYVYRDINFGGSGGIVSAVREQPLAHSLEHT